MTDSDPPRYMVLEMRPRAVVVQFLDDEGQPSGDPVPLNQDEWRELCERTWSAWGYAK